MGSKKKLMALTNDRVSRQKISLLKCSFFLKFILMESNFRGKKFKKSLKMDHN